MRTIRGLMLVSLGVFAFVSNAAAQVPVAGDDAYDAPSGRTLVVAAPGIFGNDTDGAGEDLPPTAIAELVLDATNGTLDLAEDGSFTYTPAVGFPASDVFTYRVLVGATSSNVATVDLTITGCASGPPPVTCWDEGAYVDALGALGAGLLAEGFEDDATWGAARTPDTVPDVGANGITWSANNAVSGVTTGGGPARTGQWGFFTLPHGDISGGPLDPTRDGFIGMAVQPLVGVGAWLTSNTGGARVRFRLSSPPGPSVFVDFADAGVPYGHRFFGVIDDRGFTEFEIFETEGVVEDQKLLFADDFTLGTSGAICGDGVVGPGEDCDDGNTDDGDCCSAICAYEGAGSLCGDDGNVCTTGDACDGAGLCGVCSAPVEGVGATCGAACGVAIKCKQPVLGVCRCGGPTTY